ncbi:hypothetical protein FB45DRAFT_863386 [Roridomyces roridus]|uniref:Uncharacterized protein n=1 Tax=Roridomyces roridus TaxID=1738132 RepID=A0AAD7FUI0_9AGAR|nr:hypothetical protein FB45DRAFT_863386 [Roridomyces roridus]
MSHKFCNFGSNLTGRSDLRKVWLATSATRNRCIPPTRDITLLTLEGFFPQIPGQKVVYGYRPELTDQSIWEMIKGRRGLPFWAISALSRDFSIETVVSGLYDLCAHARCPHSTGVAFRGSSVVSRGNDGQNRAVRSGLAILAPSCVTARAPVSVGSWKGRKLGRNVRCRPLARIRGGRREQGEARWREVWGIPCMEGHGESDVNAVSGKRAFAKEASFRRGVAKRCRLWCGSNADEVAGRARRGLGGSRGFLMVSSEFGEVCDGCSRWAESDEPGEVRGEQEEREVVCWQQSRDNAEIAQKGKPRLPLIISQLESRGSSQPLFPGPWGDFEEPGTREPDLGVPMGEEDDIDLDEILDKIHVPEDEDELLVVLPAAASEQPVDSSTAPNQKQQPAAWIEPTASRPPLCNQNGNYYYYTPITILVKILAAHTIPATQPNLNPAFTPLTANSQWILGAVFTAEAAGGGGMLTVLGHTKPVLT